MFKFLYSFILSDNKQDQGYIRASKLRFNTIIQYFGLNIPVTPPPRAAFLASLLRCYWACGERDESADGRTSAGRRRVTGESDRC